MSAMIKVDRLGKYYGEKAAIQDVTFSIEQGEIIGLLGLNGAGKSTILKILGCFLAPSEGEATINGFSVSQNPYAIRSLIGYLPDRAPVYPEMTVTAFLKFVAGLKDVDSQRIPALIDEAIGKTNIEEVADVRIGELSHGFQQRVGIAQALIHKPPLLILDEPINGLDPIQIVEMRDLILSLKKEHTVILSSHILSEITKTTDRILIIDRGRLVAEGSEASLTESATQSIRFTCEVDQVKPELETVLRELPDVISLEAKESGKWRRLTLETRGDMRAKVASTVIGQGVGLLSMVKEEDGLEGLFVRLVGGSEKGER